MSEVYENPLITRYASKEMSRLFSSQKKFSTWRKLWIALAESEQELGLAITDEQLDALRAHMLRI
jgi:adenylosuccinate lyase